MTLNEKITCDSKLKKLIEITNGEGHRSLFLIYGKDVQKQVMIIHHMINKYKTERPSILWCHKKDSEIPSILRKLAKKAGKRLQRGECEVNSENSFDAFLLGTKIKFCSFNDTTTILGSSFGMCVIQDFASLTPNLLCRVTETVSGGGCILVLLPGIKNLREIFKLKMDVHSKLKTHSHRKLKPLYNRRFIQSITWCKSALVLDEHLAISNELPLHVVQKTNETHLTKCEENQTELDALLENVSDGEKPLPQLTGLCKTIDQAKVLLKLLEVLSEKNGRATVSITSGRGRGKSAVLGLGVAGAINFGLSNIFVVSPVPENLSTFFEFLLKGFDALGYKESVDYAIYQSTNPDFKGCVVKVSFFSKHRQIIQYVSPSDFHQVSQAELVIIDEAAAIPLAQVKAMIGPHNVLMASTVNGYEGTGRSLSLKLLEQLRKQSVLKGATKTNSEDAQVSNCRPLHEVSLEQSIRYSPSDPVESWLHNLLCLDASSTCPSIDKCPPPDQCQLYHVNRNVVFSGHRDTEPFLLNIMSLLVASHYKNCPDDLQVLSDAPSHRLFVLLPPQPSSGHARIPSVLCVVQVCIEGNIPEHVSSPTLGRGEKPAGDLIPWSLASQFLNPKLTELTGIRIIRVASHPDYQSMGYGSRAINLLTDFYKGRFINLDSEIKDAVIEEYSETEGLITPYLPSSPLLSKLDEIEPPKVVDYIGVSFGLTAQIFRFWKRLGFKPLHVSQTPNKITGEHNCILVQSTDDESPDWLTNIATEFYQRFTVLLGGQLKNLHPQLSFDLINSCADTIETHTSHWNDVLSLIGGHDVQRLESYSKNMSDRHLVTDLFTPLAQLYYGKYLKDVHLSNAQGSILIGMGFQMLTVEEVANLVDLPIVSCLGQLNRMVRRLLSALVALQEKDVARNLPTTITDMNKFNPVQISLDLDLEQAAQEYESEHLNKARSAMLGNVSRYAVKGDDKVWESKLDATKEVVSIKSMKKPPRMTEQQLERELANPGGNKKKPLKRKR